MSDVNTLLWQTEIFLSMSTKVADPSLAATLRHAADSYLTKATEALAHKALDHRRSGKLKDLTSPSSAA